MITKLNKKSVVLQNLSLQSGTAFLSYEELASLAKLQERLTDENDVNDFITRSANVPGSTEIASCVAKKYMDDPSLMDNLVVKSPISYTFANHWKLCFKGAVYHAFINITQ